MAAVTRPGDSGEAGASGKTLDASLGIVREILHEEGGVVELAARAVRRGIDPHTGEAQFGFGQLRDGRQGGALEEEERSIGGR